MAITFGSTTGISPPSAISFCFAPALPVPVRSARSREWSCSRSPCYTSSCTRSLFIFGGVYEHYEGSFCRTDRRRRKPEVRGPGQTLTRPWPSAGQDCRVRRQLYRRLFSQGSLSGSAADCVGQRGRG